MFSLKLLLVAFTLTITPVDGFQAAIVRDVLSFTSSKIPKAMMMMGFGSRSVAEPSTGSCQHPSKTTPRRQKAPLFMIDPATIWTTTIGGMDPSFAIASAPQLSAAVIGAAAGALSQLPQIQSLNAQVTELQMELELSQANLTAKIHLLEDKLFEMDREYEDQTARFKKQYDTTQRQQLEQIKDKLKMEYQYKLEIQLEERKSEELMKKVGIEHTRTSQQQDLLSLQREKQKLAEANLELEKALQRSEEEMKTMVEAAAAKPRKRFLLF